MCTSRLRALTTMMMSSLNTARKIAGMRVRTHPLSLSLWRLRSPHPISLEGLVVQAGDNSSVMPRLVLV